MAPLVGFALLALATPSRAASWFVDGANGALSNPGTAALPYLYAWQAMRVVQPGDTIYVLPTAVYPQISVSVSGTAAAPISIVGAGAGAARTRVVGSGASFGIWINADYINVSNFDATAIGTGAAIAVVQNHHHVTISGNIAHDSGGGGIGTFTDDYITISRNIVYGNSKNTTQSFTSGISLLGSYDIDASTATKMIVDSNVIYANTNAPSCQTPQCLATWSNSDGSGIIVDDSQRQRFDHVAYHGHTQISNNVIFGNGGRGVHVYRSDHISISDNTIVFNNKDPYEGFFHPGEVILNQSGDIQVTNNILFSDGLTGPSGSTPNTHFTLGFENCADGTGPMVVKNNLTFNPQNAPSLQFYVDPGTTNPLQISGNYWADPRLENPAITTPATADFRPRPTSPALRRGAVAPSVTFDILGKQRFVPATIGAYQTAGP